MNNVKSILALSLFVALSFNALAQDFKSCKVAESTSLRLFGPIQIEKDSLAQTYDEKNLSLEMILQDEMIFFISPTGTNSRDHSPTMVYQWFYNKPQPVGISSTDFTVDSFGEIVHLKIEDKGKTTIVTYTGDDSGNYLTLICEKN